MVSRPPPRRRRRVERNYSQKGGKTGIDNHDGCCVVREAKGAHLIVKQTKNGRTKLPVEVAPRIIGFNGVLLRDVGTSL